MHRLNIVHGDISPRNIVFDIKSHKSYVIDFGAAEIIDIKRPRRKVKYQTNDEQTNKYLSPEYVRDNRILAKSLDIWSIGVVIFEMIYLKYLKSKFPPKLNHEVKNKKL